MLGAVSIAHSCWLACAWEVLAVSVVECQCKAELHALLCHEAKLRASH